MGRERQLQSVTAMSPQTPPVSESPLWTGALKTAAAANAIVMWERQQRVEQLSAGHLCSRRRIGVKCNLRRLQLLTRWMREHQRKQPQMYLWLPRSGRHGCYIDAGHGLGRVCLQQRQRYAFGSPGFCWRC